MNNLVWGGLYEVKHNRWEDKTIRNDQIYRQAVPCMRKDGTIWMQDTHQIRSPSMRKGQAKTEAAIERILKFKDPDIGDGVIRYSIGQWYHTGNEKVDDENIDDYELICDLNEYRPFESGEDYRDFDENDVVHGIHLYNEHGYSWDFGDIGVKLVRKDAHPLVYNQFKAALQDTYQRCNRPSFYSSHNFDKMVSLHKKLIESGIKIHPRIQTEYENTIWLTKRLEEMRDEISKYLYSNRYCPEYDYEKSSFLLKHVHPDMERYLKEGCYCPNEIYGGDGFVYELFMENSPCKLVFRNDLRCAVICKGLNCTEPEIVLFGYDDLSKPGRIISAIRFDLTLNNLEIAKKLISGDEEVNLKLDTLSPDTFPDDINCLINSLDTEEI